MRNYIYLYKKLEAKEWMHDNNKCTGKNIKFKRVVNGLISGGQLLVTGMLSELVVEVEEDGFNNSCIAKVTVHEMSRTSFVPPIYIWMHFRLLHIKIGYSFRCIML